MAMRKSGFTNEAFVLTHHASRTRAAQGYARPEASASVQRFWRVAERRFDRVAHLAASDFLLAGRRVASIPPTGAPGNLSEF
jgi:hypothetical protein